MRASLKRHGRIELLPACITPAPAIADHRQRAVALGAAAAEQHDVVVESLCSCHELLHGRRHVVRKCDDVHAPIGCSSAWSAVFWFWGVNLRLQLLQNLSLRTPIVLVLRTPLLMVSLEPQPAYGHLNGLPLVTDITSCDTRVGPQVYKPVGLAVGTHLLDISQNNSQRLFEADAIARQSIHAPQVSWLGSWPARPRRARLQPPTQCTEPQCL
jgi:hypothetical protein